MRWCARMIALGCEERHLRVIRDERYAFATLGAEGELGQVPRAPKRRVISPRAQELDRIAERVSERAAEQAAAEAIAQRRCG